MFVIRYKTFFITLSAVFVAVALGAIIRFGIPLGIDFKGGSELSILYTTPRPEIGAVKSTLETVGFGEAIVQPTGTTGVVIKTTDMTDTQRAAVVAALSQHGEQLAVENFTNIGPSVGAELKHKAIVSIVLVLIAIILFVAYAFRKVARPVSSWKYGFAVIIALIHDIIIPLGAFAILAHTTGAQADTLLVVALLTTLALSISDTIVVFDRIREHIRTKNLSTSFEGLVGESLSETFVRSINTSLMVLIMVVTLAVVGPVSTRLFATILAIGMFFGTYSSIFLASPLLTLFAPKGK